MLSILASLLRPLDAQLRFVCMSAPLLAVALLGCGSAKDDPGVAAATGGLPMSGGGGAAGLGGTPGMGGDVSSSGGREAGGGTGGSPAGGSDGAGGSGVGGNGLGGSGGSDTSHPPLDEFPAILPDRLISCSDLTCPENSFCVQGWNVAQCVCDVGFRVEGATCVDIDECSLDLHGCAENASCSNTEGSYSCSCKSGEGDGFFCGETQCTTDLCGTGTCIATAAGPACECPLGTGGLHCELDCTGPLEFSPELEAVVRQEVSKPSGDILASDFEYHTYLSAYEKGISDLSGLECWSNLRDIDLASNNIKDISALAGLSQVTMLNLTCNPVEDLSPISHLSKLKFLNLEMYSDCPSDLPLDDLSPLGHLRQLTGLQIGGRKVGSIEPLGNLKQLERLVLVNAGVSDVGILSGMHRLSQVYLYSNDITSVAPLLGGISLLDVWLSSNPLDNIDGLEALPRLLTLDVADVGISSSPTYGKLNQLHTLSAADNGIVDATPFGMLTNIAELDLSDNQIASVLGLAQLSHLGYLALINNQITDLAPFVDNPEFGKSGSLSIGENPLDCATQTPHIEALESRGMTVWQGDGICPP